MNQYLYLIPFVMIYSALFFVVIPRIEGRGAKFIIILLLIPVAYFLAGYVDQYIPRFLRYINRRFDF